MNILNSLFGIFVLLFIAWLFSDSKRSINWRTVGGALLIQVIFAGFVLAVPFGQEVLSSLSSGVEEVMGKANDGINFLFGGLADPSKVGFIFAIKVLPMIIFFSALISVLYHLGIMQAVVKFLGGGLQKFLGTSRTESISATGNIFVGQTEAPLLIRPYIPTMTRSELFAVMTGGLASVAGSVLAGYASLGVNIGYLIAASFMAAPGGLLMAKIIVPETETPEDTGGAIDSGDHANVLDAAATGASSGMMLAVNVGAMLLAFIALISLLNSIIGWGGGLFGIEDLTIQEILGYVFSPIAWALGVPWEEANMAGSIIGQKVIVNEFVAYIEFIDVKDILSSKTQAVISFALCGFANLSSIAILLGGLGVLAPKRRSDIASLGLKAVLAGTLSNLMSAALAGLFL
ncbi:NupC/NupG family nucleoside CNT transporter [Sansalvadorimonas verongulae]|uniref:NupC/NupG family nucleoside CNT transporter n=1 Tax=Sansalvadorimonas verongulae TaxID=2172824 RepID=UPI0012BD1B55|nr:NupC/NupG family nucleoside CNT transporter [Sansalvadorimonas verongulae]MTI12841.1 NupC/NupG family nucleoside CNT transporter [Sansalvadorimonas verongulae]